MEENKTKQNNQGNLKTIKTYMSDMADTVRANEISVIKVALAEQNKHEREDLYRQAEGTPTKKVFWFIGGLVLIAAAIYGVYFFSNKKEVNNTVIPIVKEETLISYDNINSITIKENESFIEKINAERKETGLTANSGLIKYISINRETNGVIEKMGARELFSRIESSAPSSLIRSISDSFMFGLYTEEKTNDNPGLFIILETNDFNFTYAGMLEWEKTMASDMYDLFKLKTKESKLKISERAWKDIFIDNKDARVLYNEDNEPILYYIFADRDNLVITDNQEAIKEIISRLIIKNIKPL